MGSAISHSMSGTAAALPGTATQAITLGANGGVTSSFIGNGSNGLGFLQEAAKRGFPVMFGESTLRQNPMKWAPWFDTYFSLIHDPKLTVRSFNYIK